MAELPGHGGKTGESGLRAAAATGERPAAISAGRHPMKPASSLSNTAFGRAPTIEFTT
jgi:hypothetical protein